MYRVTSSHLGPDARRTRPGSDLMDRGELSAEELTELLDAFVEVDASDNEEFDPHLVVGGRGAKLIIRTSRGRLQVYDVRDHTQPALEMTVPSILDRLDHRDETRNPFTPEVEPPLPTAPHRGIAVTMLLVGLALNGYILYSVFYVESVNKRVDVKLIADADEMRSKEISLAGTYATGGKTGDRVIVVDPTGGVRFYEIGAGGGPIDDSSDTYQVGRHDGTLCLTTAQSGVVDLVGETLVYYRDVYARRRPGSATEKG